MPCQGVVLPWRSSRGCHAAPQLRPGGPVCQQAQLQARQPLHAALFLAAALPPAHAASPETPEIILCVCYRGKSVCAGDNSWHTAKTACRRSDFTCSPPKNWTSTRCCGQRLRQQTAFPMQDSCMHCPAVLMPRHQATVTWSVTIWLHKSCDTFHAKASLNIVHDSCNQMSECC